MKTLFCVGVVSIVTALLAAAGGCSPKVESAANGGGSATDTSTDGSNGGAGTSSHPDGGSPNPTGGVDPPTCTAGQPYCGPNAYCSFGATNCGAKGLAGICLSVPDCSNGGGEEVCGCDGKTYAFACLAFAAGVDVAVATACVPPPGTFPCGYQFCPTDTFCGIQDLGGADNKRDFTCFPLPSACAATPSCDCLAGFPPCAPKVTCTADASGNLTQEWAYCD